MSPKRRRGTRRGPGQVDRVRLGSSSSPGSTATTHRAEATRRLGWVALGVAGLAVALAAALVIWPGARSAGSASDQASAGPEHVHEPSGFVPIAVHGFDSLPPAGPPGVCKAPGIEEGCWFSYDPGGNLSVVSEPGAPASPPGVLQVLFPVGVEPGGGVGLFQGWDRDGGQDNAEYRAVYESGWVRVPSSGFEMNAVGVKFLGYLGVARAGGDGPPTQVYFFFGNHPYTGRPEVRKATGLGVVQQGNQDRRMDQNMDRQPLFTFGEWHHYEYLMTLNDLGVANGTVKVWLDGRLILEYDDVVWRDSANPSGFWGRRWDPIWGGGGDSPKSRDDRLQIDHLYISGLPLD